MTKSEAIEFIKERIALIDSNYTDILDYKEALQISVKALEKQISKKLINTCPYCGQRID